MKGGKLGAPDTGWFVMLGPVVPDKTLWRGWPPVFGPRFALDSWGPFGALLFAAVMQRAPNLEHRPAKLSPLPKTVGAVESPMLIRAGIVVPVGGPGCWLLGPALHSALGSWGAAVKSVAVAVC